MNNHPGRPAKVEQSAIKHLTKCYTGKQFTSKQFVNSFRLQLRGGKTPENVKAGMILNKLTKKGTLQVVGEQETGKRGINYKIYKMR